MDLQSIIERLERVEAKTVKIEVIDEEKAWLCKTIRELLARLESLERVAAAAKSFAQLRCIARDFYDDEYYQGLKEALQDLDKS